MQILGRGRIAERGDRRCKALRPTSPVMKIKNAGQWSREMKSDGGEVRQVMESRPPVSIQAIAGSLAFTEGFE